MQEPHLQIFPDADTLALGAAEAIAQITSQSIESRGVCSIALSGGKTPVRLFEHIAKDYQNALDWEKVHFFWVDERNVSQDHPDSNYRLAHESLLRNLPIPLEHLHRIPTGRHSTIKGAERTARKYEDELARYFESEPTEDQAFDIVLLGLGTDGHTGSLITDSDPSPFSEYTETKRAIPVWVPQLQSARITLTADFINLARNIIFMVSGETKAKILKSVLEAKAVHYPAQLIHPVSNTATLSWLVDQAAASLLNPDLRASRCA
ncbi:MAG: 6-phosphogluconolactonase [Oligoflexia bacterium]|nr:6-phosphogluconolactonase [Oligoflexia bacterium]